MQELLVSALSQSDALTKLLIEKGLITQAEFMQKLSAEMSGMGSLRYQAGLTATASASSYSRTSVSPQPRQASVIEVP